MNKKYILTLFCILLIGINLSATKANVDYFAWCRIDGVDHGLIILRNEKLLNKFQKDMAQKARAGHAVEIILEVKPKELKENIESALDIILLDSDTDELPNKLEKVVTEGLNEHQLARVLIKIQGSDKSDFPSRQRRSFELRKKRLPKQQNPYKVLPRHGNKHYK